MQAGCVDACMRALACLCVCERAWLECMCVPVCVWCVFVCVHICVVGDVCMPRCHDPERVFLCECEYKCLSVQACV